MSTPFIIAALIITITVVDANIRGNRSQHERRIDRESDDIIVRGECTHNNIINAYKDAGKDITLLPDKSTITSICNDAVGTVMTYHDITDDYQFTKNYFDGGTKWNHGSDNGILVDASQVHRIAQHSIKNRPLELPKGPQGQANKVISNFDGCEYNTAMCCFIQGSQEANTQVCTVDLDAASRSNHSPNGWSVYNGNDQDKTYCEGFQWDDDDTSFSNRYKGNTLFEISMRKGLYNNGLTQNVPGAPMCGCIDQMPVVTNAACMKPIEAYTLSTSTGSLIATLNIQYTECEDLSTRNELSDRVVGDGNCDVATNKLLSLKGYTRGQAWWFADEDLWIPIVGKWDQYWYSMESITLHNSMSNQDDIIWRVCTSCKRSHRSIFYKRLTKVPSNMDLLQVLKNSWTNESNVLGEDFELYSTLLDAQEDNNRWKYCNFSSAHGFPYECGPEENTANMWNSFTRKDAKYAQDIAFYLYKRGSAE